MVKVIGVSREEQEREARCSKLVELTKKCLPSHDVRYLAGSIVVQGAGDEKKVYAAIATGRNQIDIYTGDFFDSAMKLGLSYEKDGEKEWTVKKCYEPETY
ncbi:MAG: hypothetical protein AABX65_02305 [Nanoarchaeota archaeon]